MADLERSFYLMATHSQPTPPRPHATPQKKLGVIGQKMGFFVQRCLFSTGAFSKLPLNFANADLKKTFLPGVCPNWGLLFARVCPKGNRPERAE